MEGFVRHLTLTVLLISLLAACGQRPSVGEPAAGQPKRVLATFTVIADMVRNVAGDALVVESITKVGTEIHDYEPTPSDIVRAQRADLIINNGLGLERWFEKFMGALRDVPAVDVSAGIVTIPIADGPYKDRPNPHAWMSLSNARVYIENIRKALIAIEPASEPVFNANAAAYLAKFAPLEAQLAQAIGGIPERQRGLVTCEGAFSYFARDAGLTETYMWAINSDQEGTPDQVKRVIETVRERGIPVVFCESTVNARAMEQVARETGARFGGTLYVDSLTAAGGEAPTYLAMLTFNVDALVRSYGAVKS